MEPTGRTTLCVIDTETLGEGGNVKVAMSIVSHGVEPIAVEGHFLSRCSGLGIIGIQGIVSTNPIVSHAISVDILR